jgi:hypothetical protein
VVRQGDEILGDDLVCDREIAVPEVSPGDRVDRTGQVCQTDAIRTTLDIDDDLMRTLLDRLPGRSKTDAIEHAIEAFLADDAVDRLTTLAGTMEIADVSHELRKLDRTT